MKKILITGGNGLVGKSLKKYIPQGIYLSSKDYDLTNENQVISLFKDHQPDIIIHLAAKVGGILDNIEKPADYFTENILMNSLMVKYSHIFNVERFIGVLSTCIYPDISNTYPLNEIDLHQGPPTETNFSYGYAKRSLAVQIDAYNKQYGTKYNYLIPCNLYGFGDKDDIKKSHFITALNKKIYDANKNNDDNIIIFGDGTPLRQFMFADDFASVINKVIENDVYENLNVATEEVYSISEMVNIALEVCNSKHLKVIYDKTKPNGQYRKDVSIKKLKTLLRDFKPISLKEGIKKIYTDYDKIS
jgi:GDP-L-fucose synthase